MRSLDGPNCKHGWNLFNPIPCPKCDLEFIKGKEKVMSDNYKADGTPTHTSPIDGTLRKSRYGTGRQPWDDMVDLGWAPYFAAASILKYLRRDKDQAHSIESARWYYIRLREMAESERDPNSKTAFTVLHQLTDLLTGDELSRIV